MESCADAQHEIVKSFVIEPANHFAVSQVPGFPSEDHQYGHPSYVKPAVHQMAAADAEVKGTAAMPSSMGTAAEASASVHSSARTMLVVASRT